MIINLRCENNDIQSLMFLGAPAEAFGERSDSTSILTFDCTKTIGLFTTSQYKSNGGVGVIGEVPKQILYRGIPIASSDSDRNFSIDMEALQELVLAERGINLALYIIIKECTLQEINKYILSLRNGIDKTLSENDKQKNIKRYKDFLLGIFFCQLTPLNEVLKSDNPEKMKLYMGAIKEAYRLGWISNEEYTNLLLCRNNRGHTPLHEACRIGNHFNLLTYLCEAKAVLNKKQYVDLLLGSTLSEKYTPLHSVLFSGSVESLDLYIQQINELIEQGELTKEAYWELLLRPALDKSTPLHSAARSNSDKIVERFLEILKKELPQNLYRQALDNRDAKGNPPGGNRYNGQKVNHRLIYAKYQAGISLCGEGNGGSRSSSYSNSPKVTVFSPASSSSSHSSPKQGQNNYASNYSRTSY